MPLSGDGVRISEILNFSEFSGRFLDIRRACAYSGDRRRTEPAARRYVKQTEGIDTYAHKQEDMP